MKTIDIYIKNSTPLDDIQIHEAEITAIQDGFWDCNNKGLLSQEINLTKRKEQYNDFFLQFIVLSDCKKSKNSSVNINPIEKEMMGINYYRKKLIINEMKKFVF